MNVFSPIINVVTQQTANGKCQVIIHYPNIEDARRAVQHILKHQYIDEEKPGRIKAVAP